MPARRRVSSSRPCPGAFHPERIIPVPESDPTLADLTRRLHAGDPTAFSDLFRRMHTPLLRYARRIVGEDAAYDVLQDVFLKLWETRDTLTVTASLKALLYTMTRNRALNLRRQAARLDADAPVEAPAAPAPTALDAADLKRHLHRWIEQLPERRAEAFVLSRYHGLTHHEIAGIMGVSKRTVDTHILLALRHLRERLDALENQGVQS